MTKEIYMTNIDHQGLGEANLHALTDDLYFDDLHNNPVTVFDADGRPLVGLFDDVVDERDKKENA